MKIMFLDESGDHNLSVIDPNYPLFVLGGIIVDKVYAETVITEKINQFKTYLFGRNDIILHTADITRNRNGFERMMDSSFREMFYIEINALMAELEYSVIACVIKKEKHLTRYGLAAVDPYMLSLDIIVERFCMELGDSENEGIIIAERRGPTLDHEIELAWMNLKIQGTKFITASQVEKRVSGLHLRHKHENIAGLQLADLVVTPIGRYILEKQIKEDFKIIQDKFRRSRSGQIEGYGLVVLPK